MKSDRGRWLLAFAVFAAVGVFTAWYRMHSGFQKYDDEGFLLITLKQFLDGHKLYDEVFTFYGPFHYGWQAFLFRVTGRSVSHDAVRTFSVIPWTLVPLLAAGIVYRVSRSIPVAAVAQLAVFSGLVFFVFEPGQPQEICIVLFMLLAAVLSHPGRGPAVAVAAGLLVAMLTLSKVNAGAFAALATGLTLLLRVRSGMVRNLLLTGMVAATVLLPFFILRSFSGAWARPWMLVATATLAGAVIVAFKDRAVTPIPLRDALYGAAAFGAGVVVILAPFLYWGTTLKGLVQMMILRVSGGMQFEIAPNFDGTSMVSCVAAVLLATAYSLGLGGKLVRDGIVAMRWVFGVLVLSAALNPLSYAVFLYASPWVWLVAVGDLRESSSRDARIGICLLAALQTLWAIPVAPHIAFVDILLMLAAAICVADSLTELQRRMGNRFSSAGFLRTATFAVVLLVLAGHAVKLRSAQTRYSSLVPLDLPGARDVHVPADQYRLYHWAVNRIQQDCGGFLTMPAMNSYYFWTERNSPTLKSLTNWEVSYDDAEQQQMVTDFSRVTRPCVIQCPSVMELWAQGRPLERRPLVNWIDEHLQPVETFEQDCRLLTSK